MHLSIQKSSSLCIATKITKQPAPQVLFSTSTGQQLEHLGEVEYLLLIYDTRNSTIHITKPAPPKTNTFVTIENSNYVLPQ